MNLLAKIWPRRNTKRDPSVSIKREQVFLEWNEVFRRIEIAKSEIYPMAQSVKIFGADPDGNVFAALIAASSDRIYFASDIESADVIVFGFPSKDSDLWQDALPNKTIVIMIDKTDARFDGKWVVLPWAIRHRISKS